MDARDICRRLNCSPIQLSAWVERGCPVRREPPFAHYVTEEVTQWLADNGITDWPKESDYDLDVPIRSVLKAPARRVWGRSVSPALRSSPGEVNRNETRCCRLRQSRQQHGELPIPRGRTGPARGRDR